MFKLKLSIWLYTMINSIDESVLKNNKALTTTKDEKEISRLWHKKI